MKFHCEVTEQKSVEFSKRHFALDVPRIFVRHQIISLPLKNILFPWQSFSTVIGINRLLMQITQTSNHTWWEGLTGHHPG